MVSQTAPLKVVLTVLKGDTGRITCSRKALDHCYLARHDECCLPPGCFRSLRRLPDGKIIVDHVKRFTLVFSCPRDISDVSGFWLIEEMVPNQVNPRSALVRRAMSSGVCNGHCGGLPTSGSASMVYSALSWRRR